MARPDRTSPEHAERVLVALVADPPTRAAIVDAMAKIAEAASVHPASWSITLRGSDDESKSPPASSIAWVAPD